MKSGRNKTIDISIEHGQAYLQRCLTISSPPTIEAVKNRIILGDTLAVVPMLPRQFVDLMIVDPPYNLDKNFHGQKFSRQKEQAYREYTIAWVEKCLPLLKPTASIYVCCDWKSSLIIGSVLMEYFQVQNRITWQREKGRGAKSNWKNGMEDVWFATNSSRYTFHLEAVKIRKKVVAPYRVNGKPKDWDETEAGNFRDTCPSNFWDDISIPYWSMPENTAHPTQKPEKLLAKIILASSNASDMVFDPFIGSGTTAVVAKKLGRTFVGIEHNPQYCVWAQKRLEMADNNPAIQGFSDGIFWERNTASFQKVKKTKQTALQEA